MNFQFYVEKLKNSKDFKSFIKENKGAFLCSCFFVIDKEEPGKGDKQHFDFYVPSTKKAFSFILEKKNYSQDKSQRQGIKNFQKIADIINDRLAQ